MPTSSGYVLISAAKNEVNYIGFTLQSVFDQELKPDLWVIVNDGSTDSTADVITAFQKKCSFIHLISNPPADGRHFGAKAAALRRAFDYVATTGITFKYIGNLDADVSFSPDFYLKLIARMESNPKLGIIGGLCHEQKNGNWELAHSNPEWAVGGATHFFRADLFRKTNGYPQLAYGGEDTVVEYLARDAGYQVTALNGVIFHHHKGRTFSHNFNPALFFRLGIQEYMWGTSPVFELFKCVSRTASKPRLIGSIARLTGYMYAMIVKGRPSIPCEQVSIVRKQQLARLAADLRVFPRRINKKEL